MIRERDESTRHVAKRCAPKRKESKVPERVRIPLRPPFFSKKNGFLGYSLIFLVILNDKIMTSFPAAPCTASMIKNRSSAFKKINFIFLPIKIYRQIFGKQFILFICDYNSSGLNSVRGRRRIFMEMKHKAIKKGFPRIIQTWNKA